ncbi:MAG: PHP domain-containing protein [Ignavibacteriae bacterium]|nr:PHP domain-containing protein [Ignavibacteriota bacterium]MCB9206284.1 PHP domain-containing protein [Ignavibacteriales bacterium]MCB9209088.1 PHP domain-containing protein [Ignavibacteriales bacterium]MCB9217991.1 PHP domain-containing protein [Ignavibacteriales bacterium]MCB9260380.1 PHP domain-containing protein [Ignavibacteriales bacterium]
MKKIADLHTHTVFSDGSLTPKELIILAKKKKIDVIGITDHDTIDGIEEAIHYGNKYEIDIVPGLEISTDVDGKEVHLLGYFINYKDEELNKYLQFFRNERIERARRILKKLEKINIKISIKDILKVAKNSPICRPHIAKVMLEKGFVNNFFEAFNKYIGDNGPAFERKIHVSPQSAIKIINDSGGLAFLAHPNGINESIITNLINLGIDGIEVVHSSHKKYQQRFYRGIVNQYCLLESGGSDFHGGMRNDEENFGKYVTSLSVVENIRNMAQTKYVS